MEQFILSQKQQPGHLADISGDGDTLESMHNDRDRMERACAFIVERQRRDGGWSESVIACGTKEWTDGERLPSSASSTSASTSTPVSAAASSSSSPSDPSYVVSTGWALLTLLRGGCKDQHALDAAANCLVSLQTRTGDWPQQGIAGVFNKSCGITYTAYRNVFPIWALGKYLHHKNNRSHDKDKEQ